MNKKIVAMPVLVMIVLMGPFFSVAAQMAGAKSSSAYQDNLIWLSIHQQLSPANNQQSSGLQKKIEALGTVPVPAFPIPVLSGIGIKDISHNFGEMRYTGRSHPGEDIMAVKGTPIVSPTDAVVILVTTNSASSEGNAVYTANPGGETFVYYHLDSIGEGVVFGLVLKQGSLIGYVGDSGSAKGAPHLHFEVRNSFGVATDPGLRFSEVTLISLSSDIFTITQNLYYGVNAQDVKLLQKFLNAHGFTVAVSGVGSSGHETTYFGQATRRAVIKFQIAHSISPSTGSVGPLTRTALASI